MRSRLTQRQRLTLRGLLMLVWLVLALVIVAPALAQDGGATASGDGDPTDIQEVAAQLAPLLVGAALIERLIEALFSWSERALLDVSRGFVWFANWLNGTAVSTARDIWHTMEQLNEVKAKLMKGATIDGTNPDSLNPADWPLDKVEAEIERMDRLAKKVKEELTAVTNSEQYRNHRKSVAMWLSIGFGLVLAFGTQIRLFDPLGITVGGTPFEIADIAMAGLLMGLGTDYVHQFVNVFAKGQRLLGTRAEQPAVQIDMAAIRTQIAADFKQEMDTRVKEIEEQLGGKVKLPDLDDEAG